ncbi:sugar phosphate isomerase/epimerase family protein [uncultured Desulfosarcina sp.]|uniref:sugar phosphate isomerase/epimerase family protein n=1 Tax=uncultured Desulfosarcina sp. TaxID=218289 RepID=UPI0029C777EF|nr:sugar phosphate isomerase/epimerase family protein [uncultured Desulfosarcina sp.]
MKNPNLGKASDRALKKLPANFRSRWLRTLNVTDAPAHTDSPHCGSIGHVLPFQESCRLAQKFGFDAINADRRFLREHGPSQAIKLMTQHHLKPGAFAFSAAFNACYSNSDFEQSLALFEQDLSLCRDAGFTCCVGYVQPSSNTLDYYDHFALLRRRLKRIKPLLEAYAVRLGLEFIGPTTMRRERRFDFIHTLDGIRALIAAANSQHCVGIKLDALHWYTSGAGLLDLERLSSEEVVYVEVNDGLDGDYDRFTLPEFQRELPGATGMIDLTGMLKTLDALGFDGPIVVEPWNEPLRKMSPPDAIEKVKIALDRCLEKANIVLPV